MDKVSNKARIMGRRCKDPGLYHWELDLYFNVFDSLCGYRSSFNEEMMALAGCGFTRGYTFGPEDRVLRYVKHAKRAWRRLRQLSGRDQITLQRWYEPRQYFPKEFPYPKEDDVRRAHEAYTKTGD